MDAGIPQGVKRKCRSADQIKSSKRRRPTSTVHLLDLSDCALLQILKFLDATSLYQLGETCGRFAGLVQDESLWIHVDARSAPNSWDKVDFCWKNAHKRTKRFLLAGTCRSQVVLSVRSFIHSNKLRNLTVLALEHQTIKYCKLSEFPNSLRELSLRHSYIPNHTFFFRHVQSAMYYLKTLILDHCQWLEAGCLMSLCRLTSLEILSLYMCKKLGDDDISSVSMAGKFGFRALKVVDLRFTGLGDLFIKTFYKLAQIQVIYFQCFPMTYREERRQRKEDIINGERLREHAYMSDDDADDMSKRSLRERFGAKNLVSSEARTITDITMTAFNRLKASVGNRARPESYLYSYPYDECTCGFFDRASATSGNLNPENEEPLEGRPLRGLKSLWDLRVSAASSDSSDNDDMEKEWYSSQFHPRHCLFKKKTQSNVYFVSPDASSICPQMVYDSCMLPAWCQAQSTPSKVEHKWMHMREPRNDHEIAMLEHTEKNFKIRARSVCSKSNPDCLCDQPCENVKDGVIVIARGADGGLYQYTSPAPQPPKPIKKEPRHAEIKQVIATVSKYVHVLRQRPEYDPARFVGRIITAFQDFLQIRELLTLKYDTDFVLNLYRSFSILARSLRQSVEVVLQHHFVCFQDLIRQLQTEGGLGAVILLPLFFRNLLHSEGFVSAYSEEGASRRGVEKNVQENWNLPGPSGLQAPANHVDSAGGTGNKCKFGAETAEANDDSDWDINDDFGNATVSDEEGAPPFNNINETAATRAAFFAASNDLLERKLPKRNVLERMKDFHKICHLENLPPVLLPADQAWRNFNNPLRYFVMQMYPQENARDIPTNIKELSLRGYSITDDTLTILKEMELDLLDVTNTLVTIDGLQQFMMSNPHCRLIHKWACTCRPKLHF